MTQCIFNVILIIYIYSTCAYFEIAFFDLYQRPSTEYLLATIDKFGNIRSTRLPRNRLSQSARGHGNGVQTRKPFIKYSIKSARMMEKNDNKKHSSHIWRSGGVAVSVKCVQNRTATIDQPSDIIPLPAAGRHIASTHQQRHSHSQPHAHNLWLLQWHYLVFFSILWRVEAANQMKNI